MKALRQQRKATIDRARKAIKTQTRDIKAVSQAMEEEGGRTIPEIAEVTRMPASLVLLYVATMKKYGVVAEGAKDGDFFKYELADA